MKRQEKFKILSQYVKVNDVIRISGALIEPTELSEKNTFLRLAPFLDYTACVIMAKRLEGGSCKFLLSINNVNEHFFISKPIEEDTLLEMPFDENSERETLPILVSSLEEGDEVILSEVLYTVRHVAQVFEGDFYSLILVRENVVISDVYPKGKTFFIKKKKEEGKS